MNKVMIAGHLGGDPESRFTPNGQKVTTFRVATNSKKAGKEETVWWRVTVWGDRFDKMMPYIKKGSALIIYGEMSKPEIYVDKNGVNQISLELTADSIQFSPFGRTDKSGDSQGNSQNSFQGGSSFGSQQQASNEPSYGMSNSSYTTVSSSFDDDQIPF